MSAKKLDGLTKAQRFYRKNRERLRLKDKLTNEYRTWRRLLNKVAVVNVLTHGEGTCRWCGQGDLDVLTVDHINDNGATHRRSITGRGGSMFYSWIIRNGYPDGFQVLCFNCNAKKEVLRRREDAIHRARLRREQKLDAGELAHNPEELYETA